MTVVDLQTYVFSAQPGRRKHLRPAWRTGNFLKNGRKFHGFVTTVAGFMPSLTL
jgi:hypothetical protein